MFLCTCKMQLWPPCRNFLHKTLKNFCWNSENDEKLIRFPWKLLVKFFIWHAQRNFDKPAETLSARIRKTLPNSTWDEHTFFWTKLFSFHQKGFFSNGECKFDNAGENFFLTIYRFAAQIPKTTKKFMNFSKVK